MSIIRGCKMQSKNVTLKIDSEIYDKYRAYCKDKGLIVSKQFENFIKEELKRNNKGRGKV
jgi:hypothetical protein